MDLCKSSIHLVLHAKLLFQSGLWSNWNMLMNNPSFSWSSCIFLFKSKTALFSSRWYFGKIKRIEAEKKLLLQQNEHGAFLIRDSESRRNDFSLSVRDGDTVKHYRIRWHMFAILRWRTCFRWQIFTFIYDLTRDIKNLLWSGNWTMVASSLLVAQHSEVCKSW